MKTLAAWSCIGRLFHRTPRESGKGIAAVRKRFARISPRAQPALDCCDPSQLFPANPPILRLPLAILLALAACCLGSPDTPAPPRSPENQVFQFAATGTNNQWPDGPANQATLYLWIPEACERLRGLLILGNNVPEHMLVNHPAIREVCAKNNLGIVWSTPSFWNFAKEHKGRDSLQVAFLERLLAQLAEVSGYDEVATAPWLPIGESGHLLMVCGLVNERPDRCIAAICVKNPHEPSNKSVPMLWTLGTGQEWGQIKKDIRAAWLDHGPYEPWMAARAENNWPLSLVIEFGTGHFYCSDAMADYFARYIDAAVRARVGDDKVSLRPVNLEDGVLAHLPLPAQRDLAITPYKDAPPADRARPWFFNADLARGAQELSETNPDAAPQLVSFIAGDGCRTEPYALNSVTRVIVKSDGEFEVRGVWQDKIPDGFVAAGEPLTKADGEPVVEWICGPFAPAGEGKFRIALDRTWVGRAATYLIARHEGDARTRRTVQPAYVVLEQNTEGEEQRIDFPQIEDVPAGQKSVRLEATSSAGLPVSFFVNSGPAVVHGDRLEFIPIPPRTRFPVAITVTAWQWGRASDPKVRTAAPVTRTVHILAPR